MITVCEIQETVCTFYNLAAVEMGSDRRSRCVARPRQVAMFLCREMTRQSLPVIASKFGGRDHTTILHGCRNIQKLLADDEDVRRDVTELRRLLRATEKPTPVWIPAVPAADRAFYSYPDAETLAEAKTGCREIQTALAERQMVNDGSVVRV